MNCLWIGGWASNLECWKDHIQHHYSEWDHVFINPHSLMSGDSALTRLIAECSRRDRVVAWSMGSLILHEWLVQKKPALQSLPLLKSVCPILDFCRKPGGWPARVLRDMREELAMEKEKVLRSFFVRMASPPLEDNSDLEDAWMERAMRIKVMDLDKGLRYLEKTCISVEDLKPYAQAISFLTGAGDMIAPVVGDLSSLGFKESVFPSGHLPMLSHPDAFQDFLRGVN